MSVHRAPAVLMATLKLVGTPEASSSAEEQKALTANIIMFKEAPCKSKIPKFRCLNEVRTTLNTMFLAELQADIITRLSNLGAIRPQMDENLMEYLNQNLEITNDLENADRHYFRG